VSCSKALLAIDANQYKISLINNMLLRAILNEGVTIQSTALLAKL
jgi:hypothetical protein